jgi:hypothetical protein
MFNVMFQETTKRPLKEFNDPDVEVHLKSFNDGFEWSLGVTRVGEPGTDEYRAMIRIEKIDYDILIPGKNLNFQAAKALAYDWVIKLGGKPMCNIAGA